MEEKKILNEAEKTVPEEPEQIVKMEEASENKAEKTPDPLSSDPKEPYVERPLGQRIFAWVLFGVVVLGVILYYYWIANG